MQEMRIYMEKEIITIEKPEKLTPKNVIYWMEKEGTLLGDQKSKALKFVKLGLVKKSIRENVYIVNPIKGYNITAHLVDNGVCTCQWRKIHNLECSHEIAVKLSKFIENWNDNKK